MRRRRGAPATLALAAAALVAAGAGTTPTTADASPGYTVGMIDDRLLLKDPEGAPALARRWAAEGVDAVRLHARWVALAPGDRALRKPADFDPADPADPLYTFGYLDSAIVALRAAGIRPVLSITGSGPLWATRTPEAGNVRLRPDAVEFGRFAGAVAERYAALVDEYIVWNEPNQAGWLEPQYDCDEGGCTPVSPHLYRSLLAQARPRIKAVDPGARVLVGALAPRGGQSARRSTTPMQPLPFLRSFACLDRDYRPRTDGPCANFEAPRVDGLSYHPHGVQRAPDERNPRHQEAAVADLDRLVDAVDRIQDAGGIVHPEDRRIRLHLTEFAYQTDPPDPYSGVAPKAQAAYQRHAAAIAYRHRRVASLFHYLWHDEPVADVGPGARSFHGWQSGLFTVSGRPKPAYASFVHPIWVDLVGRSTARVWGQVRRGGAWRVRLERRDPGSGWQRVRSLETDADGGFSVLVDSGRDTRWRFRYGGEGEMGWGTSVAMRPHRRR